MESSTKGRIHTHDRKVISGGKEKAADNSRPAICDNVRLRQIRERTGARENIVVIAKLLKVWIGKTCFPKTRNDLDELHKLIWVFHRQVSQNYRFNDAEDGCVSANTERQGDNGHGSEAGIALELTHAVAEVLEQGFKPTKAPHVPRDLFDQSDVAELAEG
jgi:hypothetical protein